MEKSVQSFDGTRVNYDISRLNDSFIVFLHGAGGNLAAWNKERAFFKKKKISTLAIDLRGHGKSGNPKNPDDYSIEKFAKDVLAVVNQEKIKNFILVGHCFGGMVAIMFHKLKPKLAKAYVLIDVAPKTPYPLKYVMHASKPMIALLRKYLAQKTMKMGYDYPDYDRFKDTGDFNLRRISFDIRSTGLHEWLYTYLHIANFNGTQILKSIHQEVLVIHGENDRIISIADAKEIGSLVKLSSVKIIPKTNHIIVLNKPVDVSQEIEVFYKKVFNS